MSAAPSPATPTDALRRSFHYRDLVAAGAHFRPLGDGMVAANYGGGDEAATARRLGLADLSPLPRFGFKGPRMAEWLSSRGAPLGAESNRAYTVADKALAARLAPGEVLLLGGLDGDAGLIGSLEQSWSYDVAGVWPVPRRDASFWFAITGEKSPAMFAKICGVDLRQKSFANHAIAQTSVARTNGIVIRADLGNVPVPALYLLGDSASASFMWTSVLDAMREFDGRPIGLDALVGLATG
jgi:sarcosine oxidase subunit gamma